MKIKNEVLTILSDCQIEGELLFLPNTQLDRKMYVDVNKILELMGGKWKRAKKAHEFNEDPTDLLETVLLTAEITDKKKEFQFFETPKELAIKMIEMLEVERGDNILEPSAGQGAIADLLPYNAELGIEPFLIELDKDNYDILKEKKYIAQNRDFLECSLDDKFKDNISSFSKIIMNPPFSKNQDIKHIMHAYSLLKEKGILVSIVSEHPFFANDKLSVEFRQFLEDNNAEIIKNDDGAFKESGTMVNTRIIKLKK